jgi:hypothetical protein
VADFGLEFQVGEHEHPVPEDFVRAGKRVAYSYDTAVAARRPGAEAGGSSASCPDAVEAANSNAAAAAGDLEAGK